MRMNFQRKLPIPQEVKKEFALSDKMVQVKAERDEQIAEAQKRQAEAQARIDAAKGNK